MKLITTSLTLAITASSLAHSADLITPQNQTPIATCAAEDLTERMSKHRSEGYVFENDPYQLKKIHFSLLVMDLNDDGVLTAEEIKTANPRAVGYWNKYDIDRDGSITGPEVKEYIEALLLEQWRRKYASLDRNRDGEIKEKDLNRIYYAYSDIVNVSEIMNSYDLDNNGSISISEYIETSKVKIRSSNIR